MTTEQIDAMEAGPEMDRMVQEIVKSPIIQYSASRNWNDAMDAAKRFGLFEPLAGTVLGRDGDGTNYWWIVFDWHRESVNDQEFEPIAKADTGPLAICRAILKLRVAPWGGAP